MSNKIFVTRINELNNRNKSYQIFINDHFYDTIENGEKDKVIVVDNLSAEVYIKIDWCSSKRRKIDFKKSKNVNLLVRSSIPDYLWYIIVLGLAISIIMHLHFGVKYFAYLPLLFVLIPIYKITIDKINYLEIVHNE
jgi:hypothetical protein